jgi:integrase
MPTAAKGRRLRDSAFAAFLARHRDADAAWRYPGPLSDDLIATLPPPPNGNRIKYDATLKGFGARVTAAGARSLVLNYYAGRHERRLTIGSFPDWTTAKARERATALKRRIDVGDDPMAERHQQRAAPTVNDLADRFEAEHLPKKRAGTQEMYERILRLHIRPALGKRLVAEIRHADIEGLHHRLAANAPYAANRTVAVLSKMLSLAIKWEMCSSNPARGIERAPEEKRERFLTPGEIARLSGVLATHPEKASANAIRLLLLTGARRGEVLGATWDQFDLAAGVWTKPAATTKQGRLHRVPLSAPALALLAEMRQLAAPDQRFLFPGVPGKPLQGIKRLWTSACRQAGISGARIHDLRHTYASILASRGLSLPVIGGLLGHTQAATTHRYAHLMDDPLRAATEAAGSFIVGAGDEPPAKVVRHPAGRSR